MVDAQSLAKHNHPQPGRVRHCRLVEVLPSKCAPIRRKQACYEQTGNLSKPKHRFKNASTVVTKG